MTRPLPVPGRRLTLFPRDIDRFWRYVSKGDDCWEWTGCDRSEWGYGRLPLWREGRSVWIATHRLSFWLHNGYMPELVRHTCDNPPCVRPDHLLPGTDALNLQDSIERGRANQAGLHAHNAAKRAAKAALVEAWLADGRKPCQRCRTVQPLSNYHRDSSKPDGLNEVCIACRRALRRARTRRMAA